MKFPSALLLLSTTLLAACGGTDPSADADPGKLLQQGKIEEAVQAIETQMKGVAKGTAEELGLVLDYSEALSYSDAEKAKTNFLGYAADHGDLVSPKDYKYVVSALRTQDGLLEAIDVMHEGNKRWPEDGEMKALIELIRADVVKAADPAAQNKMKSLGYL